MDNFKLYTPKAIKNNGKINAYQFRVRKYIDDERKVVSKSWRVPSEWDYMSDDEKVQLVNIEAEKFYESVLSGNFESKRDKKERKELEAKLEAQKPTFAMVVDEYINYRKASGTEYKYNTVRSDRNNLRYAIECFENKKVEKITRREGDKFMIKLNELATKGETKDYKRTGEKNKVYKTGTIIKYYNSTNSVFNYCVKMGYMEENPIKGRKPKYKNGEDGAKHDYHSKEEIKTIREKIKEKPLLWQLMTELLISTGCRRGEALGIKWENIKDDSIWLVNNLQRANEIGGNYIDSLKNSKARSILPSNRFFELLCEYKNQLLKSNINITSNDFIFFDYDKKRMTRPNDVSDYYKALSAEFGIKMNPHKFRHTMGNLMANENISDLIIAEMLGDSTDVVRKYYANHSEDRKKEASESYIKIFD